MANFLGAERRFNGQGAVGPFPSGLEIDSYTGQSSQDRSQMLVREMFTTSSVTVKICTIDEAASEAGRCVGVHGQETNR
jgi:hypothetical protein